MAHELVMGFFTRYTYLRSEIVIVELFESSSNSDPPTYFYNKFSIQE